MSTSPNTSSEPVVIYEREKPQSNRAQKTTRRTIALTKQDPIERLKELCKQGLYQYQFTWDAFANGTMCECAIFIAKYGNKKIEVAKEARFVATTNIPEAQRVVSAVLLDRLGLGDDSELEIEGEMDSQNPVDEMRRMTNKALQFATTMINKQLATLDVSPETSTVPPPTSTS